MAEQRSYICLAGHKVLYNEKYKIMIYSKNISSYFIDPISKDYMKNPVVVNGNVYDCNTINHWLSISSIDPLTGEDLSGKSIMLVPFNMLKYILYSIEDCGDTYAYYSSPTSLRYSQDIAKYLPIEKYKRSNKFEFEYIRDKITYDDAGLCEYSGMYLGAFQHMRKPQLLKSLDHVKNLSYFKLRWVDLEYLDRHKIDYSGIKLENCSDTLEYLSIEELLFIDIFTNKNVFDGNCDIYLTEIGYLLPEHMMNIQLKSALYNTSMGYMFNICNESKDIFKISIKKWLHNIYCDMKPNLNNDKILNRFDVHLTNGYESHEEINKN